VVGAGVGLGAGLAVGVVVGVDCELAVVVAGGVATLIL